MSRGLKYLTPNRLSALFTALLFLALVGAVFTLQLRPERRQTDLLLETDIQSQENLQKARQLFENTEAVLVSVGLPDLFSKRGIALLRQMSDAFEQLPSISAVKSITHSVKPVRKGFKFEMVPLVSRDPGDRELAQLRRFCLSHPLVKNVMVSPDAKHTLITLTAKQAPKGIEETRALRNELEQVARLFPEQNVRLLGLSLVELEIREHLRRDLSWMIPAALVSLAAIFGLAFRSWKVLLLLAFFPLAVASAAFALVQTKTMELDLFGILLWPMLGAIQLSFATHLVSSFSRWAEHRDALAKTWQEIFRSSLFSALTTVAGFLSLATSDAPAIREFALKASAGVIWVFLLTFGPGFWLLRIAQPWIGRKRKASPVNLDAWSTPLANFTTKRRWWIVGASFALLLCSFDGIRRIRTDLRPVEFLPEQSVSRKAVEELDRIYGGINFMEVTIDSTKRDGVNQFPILQFVERLHEFAERQPEVSGAYSYPKVLGMMTQVWEGGENLRLPSSAVLLQLFRAALQTADFPFMQALVDREGRRTSLVVRTPQMAASRSIALLQRLVEEGRASAPPGVRVSAAQGLNSLLEADRRIVQSQSSSAGLTFAAIALLLTLLWRSLWLAGLSLLANSIPIALVLALAGWADFPLNSLTVLVAGTAFGLAVDDSVHFLTYWRFLQQNNSASLNPIERTLAAKFKPMLLTSLLLVAVFSCFALSWFPPVRQFGIMASLALIGSFSAVISFLPAGLSMGGLSRTTDPKTGAPPISEQTRGA